MSTDERNTINKEIGERIKAIRKQKGITLADLGARLGISESNMQRYESGKIASVSIDFINTVYRFYHVDRNSNRTRLIGNGATDGLTYPPRSIG